MGNSLIGKTKNDYYFEKQIGIGGFSTIYLATHILNNTKVAIKVTNSFENPEIAGHRLLAREAKILMALDHQNIIKVYDYFYDADDEYLVMEYISGGTLRDHMLIFDLSLPEILDIINQLATALEYVHSRGFIHRDVKPDNILLDRNGNVILIDFGIAYDLNNNDSKENKDNKLMGSPHYFPPEQLKNLFVPHGDIYSLGIMVYELMASRLPFNNDSVYELLRRHMLEDLPTLPNSRNFPVEFNNILQKATKKEPQNRYCSAIDVAIDFTSVMDYYRYPIRFDCYLRNSTDFQASTGR